MIEMYDYSGFALQKGVNGKEELAISHFCIMEKIPFKCFNNKNQVPEKFIPVGSVEWCSSFIKKEITPDYYPEFLNNFLFRKVYKTNEWPLGKKIFIKPADKYKRFTGFVTNGGYKGKKRPPYWCSEVINIKNEWRYYVANGEILAGEWYNGDEINTPDAPILKNINIPSNFCGALDFGELNTGEIALIESQHPFACGWYGKNHYKYAEWIIKGWNYIYKLYNA